MKKISVILIGILLLLTVAYMLVGNYFFNYALNAKQEKEFLQGNPHLEKTVNVSGNVLVTNEQKNAEFISKYKPNTIVMRSFDELKLTGYEYINEQSSHKWAIIVHGYSSKASEMTKYIRHFYEKGYSVLAPDLRGHGNSEGDYIGMGWHDRKDVQRWIQQILKKDPQAEIALFGISMGGATVMMTSGEDLPPNVKVIVEDCGFSSVMDEFTYQLKDLFHLPKFPVMNAANTVTKLRAGYDLEEASAVKQVAKSKTPILFIHGDADTFVPYEMLDEVYNAAKVEKEKLIVPGAGHGEAEQANPDKYWNTLWNFVEKYISA
ncbi:alpha/beta hydrolase [Bacillus cytotoxicus]|uniref:Alpha/beta hydrolase n=2 Tax=Bacillus cytotoxicus TaxID=580165 RepID=A0AAX2CDF4_9BACI|nr:MULTISPECIES: alpha/beta hydrolase [Bacillus cereus group]ABS20623.1 alpha/beta hydrolase [Bacillus cytotoxicus NVH 391-98]AWC27257.1 alpha/beta hydrolase [Bacillus cytotoxicus]AWC31294.1 alpha/beta hydrolase [Bacillus cytotoxicus]AWC35336.1 alpha/beta hydrolase [Bacillus cytotoxicus]AWC39370.1 alpha/beta hydrolase [Bacillus cytotoxicus]